MGALDGVLDALEAGLARNGEALFGYAREWGDAAESEAMRVVGAAYVRVLIPFLRRAVVEGVFGIVYDSDVPRKVVEGASLLRETIRNWEGWLSETSSLAVCSGGRRMFVWVCE
ncbi:hypothetical protein J3R83DRAFT_6106 [Lanmaoa asiatica]|nr:hypothetical protein J3R83DRAFT_6106 [Lanmaoa asiatica]